MKKSWTRYLVLLALLLPFFGGLRASAAPSQTFNDKLIVVHYFATW